MPVIPRVIPCLLLSGERLVKTVRFKQPTYVGDPVNVVRILNDKEVDELILLDIDASRQGRGPNFAYVEQVASECFMPVAYGGGVRSLDDAKRLFGVGVEKICLNSQALATPQLVQDLAKLYGNQAVIVAIDVRKGFWGGYQVSGVGGTRKEKVPLADHVRRVAELGAGEILINSIDRDGTRTEYDFELIRTVTPLVDVPVIACGGAGKLEDFRRAVHEAGAAAVAAGSLFVFQGPHRAVLVTYPERGTLVELFRP